MHPNPAKETTSVKVILEWAKEKLLEAQVENPILDARLLLGFALGTPQERFYGSEDKILTKIQVNNRRFSSIQTTYLIMAAKTSQ